MNKTSSKTGETPLEQSVNSKLAGEASTNPAQKLQHTSKMNNIRTQYYWNQILTIQLWTYQTTEGPGSL